jgi:hypothetical protein
MWRPMGGTTASTTAEYRMDNGTTPPPPSGDVRFNNFATQSAATILYIHKVTTNGVDGTAVLTALLKQNAQILIQDKNDATKFTKFNITADATFADPTFSVPVASIASGANIANNAQLLVVIKGATAAGVPSNPITNSLGADVNLNNTGTYFTGPQVAQGTVGTWWVAGTVTFLDPSSSGKVNVRLTDGTAIIASAQTQIQAAGSSATASVSGFLASPANNLRITANSNSTTTVMKSNQSGNSKDGTITAFRIA